MQQIGLFNHPVPLLLTAQDDDGGIRAILAAVVPVKEMERAERASRAADEPWLASVEPEPDVSSFSADAEPEEVPHVPFALGVILRFPEDRKHPESIDDEALDLLATLLSGQAMDADRKRVENLLKSLCHERRDSSRSDLLRAPACAARPVGSRRTRGADALPRAHRTRYRR